MVRVSGDDGHESDWKTVEMSSKPNTVTRCLHLCMALVFVATTSTALDFSFPRLANLLGLSEKASDEIREEDRVSEVLNRDASYVSLFESVSNPDVRISDFVQPGEELRYQAMWRGLPAGTVRCTAKRVAKLKDRPVFVFELAVESNDFLNAFYPVRTSMNSYVDAGNGRSYLIRRRVSERNRDYTDRLEFKYDSRRDNGIPEPVSKYSITGAEGKEESRQPFPIPGNMQDTVSLIYYVRGLELNEVGDSRTILLGGRNKPVVITVSVTGEERIAVPGIGLFDCLVVEPDAGGANISGNFVATRGGEKIWLEKNTRIPVMAVAELPSPVGAVTATLVQADNSELIAFAIKEGERKEE